MRRSRVEKGSVHGSGHQSHLHEGDSFHIEGNSRRAVGTKESGVGAVDSLHADVRLQDAFAMGPRHRTSSAVAAKGTAAVGIAEINLQDAVVAGGHHHHAVGPHTAFTVAERFHLSVGPVGGQPPFLPAIDQDKVVACPFPFLELKRHGTKVVRPRHEVGRGAPIFGPCPNLRNRPHPQGCSRPTGPPAQRAPCPTSTRSTLG